jgi:hypothetical protein
MPQDTHAEMLIKSPDELQRLVMEELQEYLSHCEKEAAKAGYAVLGDFRVGDDDGKEPLLRIRFICEPGKAARVMSVDGLEDGSTTLSEDQRPVLLH